MSNKYIPFSLPIDSQQEHDSLLGVLDAAQRQGGVQATETVFVWLQKIGRARQAALEAAKAPDPAQPEPVE